MRRTLFLFAFAGLAGSIWAQAAEKVDVAIPAMTLGNAIRPLKEATGLQLDVATELRNEVVMLQLHDVTPAEVMKRLAEAVGGTWKDSSAGKILYRSDSQKKGEVDAERAFRVEAIRKAVAKMAEPLAKNPSFTSDVAVGLKEKAKNPLGALAEGTNPMALAQMGKDLIVGGEGYPSGRAVTRLVQMVDPSILVNMGSNDRVVFSTAPTRMQRPLPAAAFQVLSLLVKEQEVWADANKSQDNPGNVINQVVGSMFGAANGPINGTPTKALFAVQRQSLFDGYELRLKMYDSEGKEVFSGGQTMLLESSPLNVMDKIQASPDTQEAEIKLSDQAMEIMGFLRGLSGAAMMGGRSKPISPSIIAILKRPDLHDPLSLIHGEALAAVADSQKKGMVALIPDSILSASTFLVPGQQLTVAGFLKPLLDMKVVDFQDKGDWLLVKPVRTLFERQNRLDRLALAKLINAVKPDGTFRLADLAAYAVANPPIGENPVAQIYTTLLVPGLAGNPAVNNWNMLRLWASFGLTQQNRLVRGEAIPFRQLSLAQVGLIRAMVFQPSMFGFMGLSVQRAPNQPANPFSQDYRNEPTEAMPNGLPMDGTLKLAYTKATVVVDASEEQPGLKLFSAMGADELGVMKNMRDDPTFGKMIGGFLPQFKLFKVGSRTNYAFTFQLTPEVSFAASLQDSEIPSNQSAVPYDRLPADFRAASDKASEQFKGAAGAIGGLLGGTKPPNP